MKQHIALIIAFLMFSVCARSSDRVDQRVLSPFERISLRVSANMIVEQGKEHFIEITSNNQTLDKIIVEVIDRKLIIRFSWEDLFFRDFIPGTIDIKVVAPGINELSLLGSGNIIAVDPIETFSMKLNVAGSGDIKLSNLRCQLLEANISGSGDIIISSDSETRETKVNIAGSGNFKAYQFKSEAGYVLIAGSGNCDLFITNYLDARILGSGNIAYLGEPQINSRISGSGKVYRR
jgi:hypothetical protein